MTVWWRLKIKMLHWQTAAYYQAGYKREYPYGYDYPGRSSHTPLLVLL